MTGYLIRLQLIKENIFEKNVTLHLLTIKVFDAKQFNVDKIRFLVREYFHFFQFSFGSIHRTVTNFSVIYVGDVNLRDKFIYQFNYRKLRVTASTKIV